MEEKNLPELPKDVNAYKLTDALDDEQIKEELENRIVEHWVYSFKQDGRMVSNLSKAGVDACCTEMAKQGHIIEEQLVHYEPDPFDSNAMLFSVVASRVLVNFETGQRLILDTVNGTKRQSLTIKGKPNPFWFEQGAMKAARNARIRLIPEEIKVQILALAREKNRVKAVDQTDVERIMPTDNDNGSVYAEGKDKRFLEAWIKNNLDGNRDLFKEWAAELNMIHDGTMNKVVKRFVDRIKAKPDDAAASFSRWYDLKMAKDNVKEVFDDSTEEKHADSRQ